MNLFKKIKEIFSKMVSGKSIESALQVKPVISSEMSEALKLWTEMYENNSPWLSSGEGSNKAKVVSMGLPAFVASEKARTVVLEMKSEVTAAGGNAARAEYLNKIYHNKVLKFLRTQLEYGIAKGGLVIKPYFVPKGSENKGDLEFDFIQADNFFPLAFSASGKITEAAFLQQKTEKETTYTRLEHHKLEGNRLIVRNRAFKRSSGSAGNANLSDLGSEIPLSSVTEWAGLEPETVINNVDRMLFAYYKNPEANTIDTYSPLGVSAYSRATELIEEADKQFSRLLWEFEGGELAVDVDRSMLMEEYDSHSGENRIERPKLQQRLFRQVDTDDGNFFNVFNPTFREAALLNGLNAILMRIEDVCALSRGTLADVSAEARTATELKILKQRTYSSVSDMQTKSLQPALEDLIYVMDVYCTLYNIAGDSPTDEHGNINTSTIGKYNVSFEWDDSTITDTDTELSKRLTLMQNGLASRAEVRMWYFGETEEQAKKALEAIDNENIRSAEEKLMDQYEGK